GTLDVAGQTDLAATLVATNVRGTLNVAEQATFTENIDANNGVDITNADLTVGGANFTVDDATGNVSTAGDVDVTGSVDILTNLSFDGANTVEEIVTSATVDLAAPSDNALVTEGALAGAIGNQAGSGLTYDALNNEIDLGGNLTSDAILGTNGNDFSVADDDLGTTNYLTVADGGNITIGDGTITTGTGLVTLGGNLDATNGVDITGADLTVATNTDLNGTLDVAGQTDLAATLVATNVRGTLNVA
ncbi:unnamed protein product, partial [marine sediment metagenome]